MKIIAFIMMLLLLIMLAISGAADNSLSPGQYVYYGSYEQDMNFDNGDEKILWRVLDVFSESNAALLMSEFALDCVIYNDSLNSTKWGDSYARNWLQNEFYTRAFNAFEKPYIVAADASGSIDKVFLLGEADLEAYLDDYRCIPTSWAMNHGVFTTHKEDKITCSYWVRMDKTSTYGVYVGSLGGIRDNSNKVTMNDNGIRPAIFLSLNYDQDTPGARLDNLHLYERVTVPGVGSIRVTDCRILDQMGYFEPGHTGTSEKDFDKFYSSGVEAKFLVVKADVTNKSNVPLRIPSIASVVVDYDQGYLYKGWCYQYNHTNLFSVKTFVNKEDFAKQNENYVISHGDEFAIAPGETGHYCFGCTMPNAIFDGNGPLRMIIDLCGNAVGYTIR